MRARSAHRQEAARENERCIQHGPGCTGPVELRMPLSASGTPFPRCAGHWAERLDTEDRLREDYPDSSTPPAWFDPADAGETWDSDY